MISENGKKIVKYLRGINSEVTKDDVALAVGITDKQVTGVFNSLVKKGYALRQDGVIDYEGEEKPVKFLALTELGKSFDVDGEDA